MEGLTELRDVCLRNTQATVSVAAEPKERIQTSIPNMSLMSYAEAEVQATANANTNALHSSQPDGRWYVVVAHGSSCVAWDALVLLFVCYTAVSVQYKLTFMSHNTHYGSSR